MTSYVAKLPDDNGRIHYSPEENETWKYLYQRQSQLINNRACDGYIKGLEILGLNENNVPQLPDVNHALMNATGWSVEPVPALIPFGRFFELLSQRKFPAATFIRTPEEIDYLQEPDIFHEIYGHCPLLTDPVFADFVHRYGIIGLHASKEERVLLARIFWFTVEFGLIQQSNGLRIYGAGILSSPGETVYALEDKKVVRKPFDLITALRTPYRIDIYQTTYFVIESFKTIYDAMDASVLEAIAEARHLGDFAPNFPPKQTSKNPNVVSIDQREASSRQKSPRADRHDC